MKHFRTSWIRLLWVGCVLFALASAVPAFGQDAGRLKPLPGATDSTDPRPVRNRKADDDARDRLKWLRDRFGGDLGQDFARRFLDAETRWVAKTDFIGSTTGGAVAFGHSPNTLYLGTGDPFEQGVGGFVLRTTDGGDTWSSPIFLGSANKVLDLKVDSSLGHDI